MDKFLYLKLGQGNCLAEYWLKFEKRPDICRNKSKKAFAAIYFGTIRAEKIRQLSNLPEEDEARQLFRDEIQNKNGDFKAVKTFMGAEKDPKTRFVTISNSKVYFYRSIGTIKDMPEKDWKTYDESLDMLIHNQIAKEEKEKIRAAKVYDEKGKLQNIPKIMPVEIINNDLETLTSNRFREHI